MKKLHFALFAGVALAVCGSLASAAIGPVSEVGVFHLFGGKTSDYANGASIDATDGAVAVSPTAGKKATCAASITGLVPAASATDVFTLTGSATKTIRMTRLQVSGRATAAANADILLYKRSAADTAGTHTAPTIVPYVATGACSASVLAYTANPTVGAAIGVMRSQQLFLGNLTTGAPGSPVAFTFGERPAQAPTLTGIASVLAISLNAATYSGGLLDIDVEWTEE